MTHNALGPSLTMPYNVVSSSDPNTIGFHLGTLDVRTVYRTCPSRALLRPVRSQPAWQQFHRDRTPSARADPGRQGADQPHFCALASVAGEHPEGNRRPHGVPGEGLDIGRDALQRARRSASCSLRPKKPTACCTTTSARSTSCWASCARSGPWRRPSSWKRGCG